MGTQLGSDGHEMRYVSDVKTGRMVEGPSIEEGPVARRIKKEGRKFFYHPDGVVLPADGGGGH